jgi:hypothetical protein
MLAGEARQFASDSREILGSHPKPESTALTEYCQ